MNGPARGKAILAKWWLWPLVAASAIALALPAVAYAATVETYAQGQSYNSGDFILNTTDGYITRNYSRVYHASGHEWEVWFNTSSGNSIDIVESSGNPTDNNISANNVQALCWDIGDGSGTTFTCQSTHP